MIARLRCLCLAAVIGLAMPPVVVAQQPAAEQRPAPSSGPRIDATATAVRQLRTQVDSAMAQQRRQRPTGQPVALMIVGGAAIILGALIGDAIGTLFMVGGAVALLVGLFQYLQ